MIKSYQPPHHYTEAELLEADIADLEIDIKCAERDGLLDYAERCRVELRELKRLAAREQRT